MGAKKEQSCSTHVQECLFKDFEGKKSNIYIDENNFIF